MDKSISNNLQLKQNIVQLKGMPKIQSIGNKKKKSHQGNNLPLPGL